MRTLVVTGGAGYVGSQSIVHFGRLGWRTICVDDLSAGVMENAKRANRFLRSDLRVRDEALVARLLDGEQIDGILHCASRIRVGESVELPDEYVADNVMTSATAAWLARRCGCPLVFSSSAAVYGEPDELPVSESASLRPVNAYGRSKQLAEEILHEHARGAHGLRVVSLRYFNAAGADPQGECGPYDPGASHLFPAIVRAHLRGSPSESSARTTRPAMAPPCVTTCTCRISHGRTKPPSSVSGMARFRMSA